MITLYNMDVMKALKQIPNESVDMQITSPPYWGLRDYGIEGQIGLEPDFNDYIKRMCDIFDEVKRVLKKDGTCWVNLGDTYNSTPSGLTKEKGEEWKDRADGIFYRLGKNNSNDFTTKPTQKVLSKQLQPKCLTMIPERFALEMINRGWILRNKIIWHKPNHMPTSVKDRFANSWEYLFMFSKSKKYYFDLDAVREPHKTGTPQANNDLKRMMSGRQEFEGIRKDSGVQNAFVSGNPKGRNPDDVIQTKFEVGDGYRQGMNRDESELIEYRPNLPPKKEFVKFIRKHFTIKELVNKGLKKTTVEHWFRYDDGFSYPSREEWFKVGTSMYIGLTQIELKSNAVMPNQAGKNPSDFWNITTQPYKEAHFAVFPEKLVERPIKTTPKQICKKCGKARIRITENEFVKTADAQPSKIGDANRNPEERTDLPANRGYTLHHTKGWTSCKCNAGFRPAVILDIFAGSGTTLKVARDLKRDAIGIEIKKEYCDLIYKRLFGKNQTTLVNSYKFIGV